MARIAGINIPPQKHVGIGLTAIYGIGRSRARDICQAAGVNTSTKVADLTDTELEAIREEITNYLLEGDLRREIQLSIKRLIDLGTRSEERRVGKEGRYSGWRKQVKKRETGYR